MKRLFGIISFLFLFLFSFAQNGQVSELLLAAKDSIQSNLLEGAYLKCEEALALSRAEGKAEDVLRSLQLMSLIHKENKRFDKELSIELEILDWYRKNKKKEGLYNTLFRVAELYQEQKIFSKSISSYKSSLRYAPDEKEKNRIYEKMSEVYRMDKKYPNARNMRVKVIQYQEEKGALDLELYHRQILSDIYKEEGQFQNAIKENEKILEKTVALKDMHKMAVASNNLGISLTKSKDYKLALEAFKNAEIYSAVNKKLDFVTLYTNIGIAYNNVGDVKKSVKYLLLAQEHSQDKWTELNLQHKMSEVYLSNNDLYNALFHNKIVREKSEENDFEDILSRSYKVGAEIEKELYNYEKAFEYYENHLKLEQAFSLEKDKEKQRLLDIQSKLEQSEKEIRLELAAREIEENKIRSEKERLQFEKDKLELEKQNIALEKERKDKELAFLAEEQKVKEAKLAAQAAELKSKEVAAQALQEKQEQELALAQQRFEAEKRARELEESQRQQELQRLELKASQDSTKLKEQELLAAQEKEKAKQKLLEKQQAVSQLNRIVAFVVGTLSLLIIGLVLWFLRISNRKNKQLAQKNDEIEEQKIELEESRDMIFEEQKKSENLLLNILPAPIAAELKELGSATPQVYEEVTILFTDFAGFTKVSYEMDADELIDDLNECFIAFDEIVEKYGMEKIKTIGDSYMCAGGVPIPRSVPPSDVVKAAMEMNDFMKKRLAQKEKENKDYWGTRVGIHTGTVVAGVVGKNKFAYDIWGNAVNVASRMESGAEINTVNVSEVTYELIKKDFECFYRGEFHVKNKGMMKMYRVDAKK